MNYGKKTPFFVIWTHQLSHWGPDGDQVLLSTPYYNVLCQGHNSTHTRPFHTSFNHHSGQLLTISTLPVYCQSSLLAILSCSAWPLKMKALCFFEMSVTNDPVTQHHNPQDLICDCCGEHLRSCEHQLDDEDVCLSMIMSMSCWWELRQSYTLCLFTPSPLITRRIVTEVALNCLKSNINLNYLKIQVIWHSKCSVWIMKTTQSLLERSYCCLFSCPFRTHTVSVERNI
jgi:hypothetical protein